MAENDSIAEKDLAAEEKIVADIIEQINVAKLNGKEEINLSDGTSIIPIKLLKDNDNTGIEIGGKRIIISAKNGNNALKNTLKHEIVRYRNNFDFNKIHSLNINRNLSAHEYNNPEKLKLESELNEAIKDGRATKLRTGREITEGEDLSLMINRMFGVRTHEAYRVKDKNSSTQFKYICRDNAGKVIEPRGSFSNEGKRPRQMCWIQDQNGNFTRKTVDHIQILGRYAIATDIPDSVVSEHTRTLIGTRCPSGDYVFMPALDNRIINTCQKELTKDNLTRAKTVLEIEDIVLAAKLGDRIYGTKKDGNLSTEEVEFIKQLKENGVSDEKIRKIVDTILVVMEMKIQGLRDTHIKAILDTVDTVAEQINELEDNQYDKEEIKQILDMVYNKDMEFDDAESILENDKNKKDDEDRFPERGRIRTGPWDH